MKYQIIILLCFCHIALAQNIIRKKDKSTISMDSITLHQATNEVVYFVNGKENLLPYAQLDSAVIGGKVLKRFDFKKKIRIFYVITSAQGKTFGVVRKKMKRSIGGFESYVKQYEVVVIDKDQIVDSVKFTPSKTDSETKKRSQFFDLAAKYFSSCGEVTNRMSIYNTGTTDISALLDYLDDPVYLKCK
jgi:hypothetical protein